MTLILILAIVLTGVLLADAVVRKVGKWLFGNRPRL